MAARLYIYLFQNSKLMFMKTISHIMPHQHLGGLLPVAKCFSFFVSLLNVNLARLCHLSGRFQNNSSDTKFAVENTHIKLLIRY